MLEAARGRVELVQPPVRRADPQGPRGVLEYRAHLAVAQARGVRGVGREVREATAVVEQVEPALGSDPEPVLAVDVERRDPVVAEAAGIGGIVDEAGPLPGAEIEPEEAGMQKRPRVVVSLEASVDGKVALTRDALLMHQPSSELWGAMTPRAADPDTLVASAKAYLGALNKMVMKRQRDTVTTAAAS